MKKVLLLALVVSGCVHVNKDVVADRSDRPVPQESVQVFRFGDELPEECTRVAYLHVSASKDFSDRDKVVAKFRTEAGKLGANAVVVSEAFSATRRGSSFFSSPSAKEYDGEAFWCQADGGR